MDNEDEPHSRVNVQSIRKRFEGHQTMTKALVNSLASADRLTETSLLPEADTVRAGSSSGCGSGNSSNSSESDRSPTGFQLHPHNRVSIKRSPAFRTGSNKASSSSSLSPELLLNSPNNNNNNIIDFDSGKKPATTLKRKPGVDRSTKPNRLGSPSSSPDNISSLSPTFNPFLSESDAKLEEALKAPLPTGPAPKKPPRTFQHDIIILQQQNRIAEMVTSDESSGSPQRPARRKTHQQMRIDKSHHFSQPRPVTFAGIPYTLSRSKTESFLLATKKPNELKSDSFPYATEDDIDAALMSTPDVIKDSRWLNPVQWNNCSPRSGRTALSPLTKQLGCARVSSSMLSISEQNARKNATANWQGMPMGKQPLSYESSSIRRMSCDFVGGRRRFEQPANSEFTFQSTNGFHSRKGPLASAVSLGHIYDQPSTEGDLHYMCSPIIEVGARNGPWSNEQQRMTDDSDCESENDLKKSQIVEDRKIYVRRVSSNVCDLRKAARPFSTTKNAAEIGAGLFETFLVVALYYDRQLQQHTPYIKSSYPSHTIVPPGVEHFCFPDSTHWPPPLQTASEPYTIVLTDSKGERLYGYCRRVVPEGAQTCIPITYCLLSRHRAVGFYTKVLNMMVSRHGIAESQRMILLDSLHKQPFPNPGRFVEFPPEALTGGPSKVSKVQRLLDGRLEDIDLRVLFEQLNETVVLHVLGTVLLERKLIFVSQNLGVLSLCIDAVQSLLYPFMWQHTLVPVLPQSMTEISSAPTPFILGILSKNVDDWKSIYPDQGMLVDLDSGKVLHCVGDESTILPRRSIRKLCSDWEVTVNITQQAETARNALYSESFLRMFVDLCGHYEQHINIGDSGEKFFERSAFIQSHSNSSARDFLEWFTETALFTLFIESRLKTDAVPTLFEHKILEHSMHIARPNAQLILPNSKILGRKIKTIGDKLREMNVFS